MNHFVVIANRIRFWVTIAVALVMVYALYVSREHITHVAEWLGVPGWQAATAFILVDLPALIGKVLQVKYFAPTTRKSGRRLTYFTGSLSLVCNIGSGLIAGSYGAAGWGAFVVVMFLVLESVITKIRPAGTVTRARNAGENTDTSEAPATLTARQISARKGVETRKRNAELKALEAAYAAQAAPVSGA